METVEAFLDGEWESLSKLFSCEDSDILLHFNGGNLFPNNGEIPSNFLAVSENVAGINESWCLPYNNLEASYYSVSQESSNSSEIYHAAAAINNCANFLETNTFDQSMDFFTAERRNESSMVPVFPDDLMEEILHLKAQMCNDHLGNAEIIQPAETDDSCKEMQLKRKHETTNNDSSDQSPKKRHRVSRDGQRNKRNLQSGKKKKGSNDENGGGNGQSSSTCSSEEGDSNASESKGSASTAKAKSCKNPATDPQSLYARKRRERINERLRILQSLVPNGTKVDISTMLEEAVHYVKFLQLQIKLLSSDDLWMYAPIAYNGMDIGFYQKIVPNL